MSSGTEVNEDEAGYQDSVLKHGVESFCRSTTCEAVKLVLGSIAVFLLILVVFVGVSLGYCVLKIYPLANFVLLFIALLLLAYIEALHYACVAIEKWDMTEYADKFPRAVKSQKLVDTPVKVKRFLVGRQFFVILVIFLIAQITTFEDIPEDFAGMPRIMVLLLIQTGLPGVALVLTIGQLISQLYVEEFTLQFMNTYGCEFVIRLCLGAEWIGVCNFSWLLYGIVSRVAYRKVRKIQKILNTEASIARIAQQQTASEEPMSPHEANSGPSFDTRLDAKVLLNLFDYFKYLWSTVATIGSVIIVIYGIAYEAYVLPVPIPAAYIMAIVLLAILFYLEGLMVAIVGVQYWDRNTFREVYPRAYRVHELMSRPENVKRFIIGRQFFTLFTNFLLAQILVFANWQNNVYDPVLFFIVVKSGLVGVLITVAFAQLLPELLAAEYPLRFLNMPGSHTIVNCSLFFDSIGVGHAAWALYFVTRKFICGSQMTAAGNVATNTIPEIVRINSAEVLAKQ